MWHHKATLNKPMHTRNGRKRCTCGGGVARVFLPSTCVEKHYLSWATAREIVCNIHVCARPRICCFNNVVPHLFRLPQYSVCGCQLKEVDVDTEARTYNMRTAGQMFAHGTALSIDVIPGRALCESFQEENLIKLYTNERTIYRPHAPRATCAMLIPMCLMWRSYLPRLWPW